MSNLRHIRKPQHNKCYGIEIECIVPSDVYMGTMFQTYKGMWYYSGDISIQAEYPRFGAELVSQPLPFSWLTKEIGRQYKKLNWQWNSTCGIHIHVSRSCVSEKRIRKLKLFLAILSGSQIRNLFGRVSVDYADYRNTRVMQRYCAINETKEHTIEFRMWCSGDAAWAQECLRRTKLMVEYKGEWSYPNICKLFGIEEVY